MLNSLFSTSANASSESTLTMEDFHKMLDKVFPILLYGTAEFVKPGELYHYKETDLSPEYIVCHPSDLEQIKKLLPNRRLVHIKDEPQEKVIERMKRLLTQHALDGFAGVEMSGKCSECGNEITISVSTHSRQ